MLHVLNICYNDVLFDKSNIGLCQLLKYSMLAWIFRDKTHFNHLAVQILLRKTIIKLHGG